MLSADVRKFRAVHAIQARRGGLTLLVLALLVAAGGVSMAAIPDRSGKVYLCFNSAAARTQGGGTPVRIIDKVANPEDCDGSTEMAINAQGVAGPQGPQGPPGPQGPAGTAGNVYSFQRDISELVFVSAWRVVGELRVPGPGNYVVRSDVEVSSNVDGVGGVECRLRTPGGERITALYYTSDDGTSRDTLPLQIAQRFGQGGQRLFEVACRGLGSSDSQGRVEGLSLIATRVAAVNRQ